MGKFSVYPQNVAIERSDSMERAKGTPKVAMRTRTYRDGDSIASGCIVEDALENKCEYSVSVQRCISKHITGYVNDFMMTNELCGSSAISSEKGV